MSGFKALVLPAFEKFWFEREILSQSVINYICEALIQAGCGVHCVGAFCGLPDGAVPHELPDSGQMSDFFAGGGRQSGLVFFAPAPAVTAADIVGLMGAAEIEPVCLRAGKVTVAVAGKCADLEQLNLSELHFLPFLETDMPVVQDAGSALAAQELLRSRINSAHLRHGVFLQDCNSTFISPNAKLAPGCEVLPGCMIYGRSKIGPGCVIGPNCVISSAELGADVKVNASQIYDSRIGDRTTVGPFAYIRPGCVIDEDVRIGDFVELKKSNIGSGSKISHLAYIGDSDFGRRVNVGCGAVAVNYDGKDKHKTVVGDDCFIGCNVNLIAPLTIGDGAYLAAGSTLTDDVESGALAIARPRQTVKPQWVARRKRDGKL